MENSKKGKCGERVVDENQEISMIETENWLQKLSASFPALKSRNYQLYFAGQSISQVGTWIQMIAQGWLVFQLTNSALYVGIIAALGTVPVLIFGLFAGVLLDRHSKKRMIFIAEFFAMVLAFILGILTLTNHINVAQIALLSFLLGITNALDMPARQSYVVEMVGKDSLTSAIALNSGVFNAARVIGPAIAGIIIGFVGIGWAFILNGFSFITVLIALYFIKTQYQIASSHPHPIKAIKEGLKYTFSHQIIKMLLVYAAVGAIFGWSYAVIMPVIVKNIYHLGASGLGYFNAVAGLGALTGSILISIYSKRVNPLFFIVGGSFSFSIALLLFSFSSSVTLALVLLYFVGLGLIMQFATINSTIQRFVQDSFRGRVMSIYSIMFAGMTPIGSLQIGYLADRFGSQTALRIGAFIILFLGLFLLLRRRRYKLI